MPGRHPAVDQGRTSELDDGPLRHVINRWRKCGLQAPRSLKKELKRLAGVLKALAVAKMPLAKPPPRDSRFGSTLKLSKVHWVRPDVVVEVTYLT